MTEPTTPKGEQTRAAIVEAAFAQFTTNGYHGTSMRQIADSAGIAVGGIYNHFASKEDIFTGVIEAYHPFTRALPALEQSAGQTTSELLHNAAHRIIAEIEAQPKLLNLLFIELIELESRHLSKLVTTFLPMIERFARRVATAEGQFRDIAPITFMRSFMGLILAYFVTGELLAGTPAEERDTTTLDEFVDIYLYGVLSTEER